MLLLYSLSDIHLINEKYYCAGRGALETAKCRFWLLLFRRSAAESVVG
jgi:hypothetical protein